MEIIKYLDESGLLNEDISKKKKIENEVKEQKRAFLGMLAATLDANLLTNMLAGKAKIHEQGII